MGQLKKFVIHCTATPYGREVTVDDIDEWHIMPRNIIDGNGLLVGVRYKGKFYTSRDLLPDEYINGKSVRKGVGRGWRKRGYAVMFPREGEPINLTPYNDDSIVDPWEVTWGVAGINDISRHIVLVGGQTVDGKEGIFNFEELFTKNQFLHLQDYLKEELSKHKDVQVAGHNQYDEKKYCPGISTVSMCELMKLPYRNIDRKEIMIL